MVIVVPFFLIGIGSIVLAIMTAVSASKYPDYAFQQTGSSKFIWVGLPIILSLFVCGFPGGIMGIVWFSSKRDAVEAAARGGPAFGYGAPGQYGYGAPPAGTWGPPPAGWTPPPPTSAPPSPPEQPQ